MNEIEKIDNISIFNQEEKKNIEGIEIAGLDEFDEEYFYSISKDGEDEWKAIGIENCQSQKYYTVVSENNVRLGIVGIYNTDNEQNITHIIIDPKFRGKGLLPKFYDLLLQEEKPSFLTATIKVDNISSVKSHEKAGFRKISDDEYEKKFQKYKYRLELPNGPKDKEFV